MPVNLEALRKVVEVVERTPQGNIRMDRWMQPCGTVACVIGYCCLHPWFIERGLHLYGHLTNARGGYPSYKGDRGADAVIAFFGISGHSCAYLFGSTSYDDTPGELKAIILERLNDFIEEREPK